MSTVTWSARAFGEAMFPMKETLEAFAKLDAEIQAQPDKTAEESGADALAWLSSNLSYIRGLLELSGCTSNPIHDGLSDKLADARLIILAKYKRERAGRPW